MRLTRDEIILVGSILLALIVGTAVKHYRDKARMANPQPVVHPMEE